jgi:ATP synthase F1 gamma subunit
MNVFKIHEITLPSMKYIVDQSKHIDYDYDENKHEFFRNLHEFQLASALVYTTTQNTASETLSRRNAMDSANKNCKELKKRLNIEFNKLRQALITTELIEVTTGAAAGSSFNFENINLLFVASLTCIIFTVEDMK